MTSLRSDGAVVLRLVLFTGLAACTALVIVLPGILGPGVGWTLALALVAGFAAVEAIALTMPRGEHFHIVGGVGIAACMALTPVGVALVYLGGALAAALASSSSSRLPNHVANIVRRAITLLIAGYGYAYLTLEVPLVPDRIGTFWPAIFVGVAFMFADVFGWSLQSDDGSVASAVRTTRTLVSLLGAVYLGQVSVGIVLALVLPSLGGLAVLVLVVLMLIMLHTSGLLLRVRSAYNRTVSVLARTAEMSTTDRIGHGERVATVCGVLGRRLGLDAQKVERLTLAALVHDIGQIGSSPEEEFDPVEQARLGAELIGQVSFLASLAPVVRRLPQSYEEFIDPRETDGLLSRIVRVASDYDDAADTASGEPCIAGCLEAFVGLSGSIYDPRVVDALVAAIDKREITP